MATQPNTPQPDRRGFLGFDALGRALRSPSGTPSEGQDVEAVGESRQSSRREFMHTVGAAGVAAAAASIIPGTAEAQITTPPMPDQLIAKLDANDKKLLADLKVDERQFAEMCLRTKCDARQFHAEVQPGVVPRLQRMAGGSRAFSTDGAANLRVLEVAAQDIVSGFAEPPTRPPEPAPGSVTPSPEAGGTSITDGKSLAERIYKEATEGGRFRPSTVQFIAAIFQQLTAVVKRMQAGGLSLRKESRKNRLEAKIKKRQEDQSTLRRSVDLGKELKRSGRATPREDDDLASNTTGLIELTAEIEELEDELEPLKLRSVRKELNVLWKTENELVPAGAAITWGLWLVSDAAVYLRRLAEKDPNANLFGVIRLIEQIIALGILIYIIRTKGEFSARGQEQSKTTSEH